MPLGPAPARARAALSRLEALQILVGDAEDEVLASLVVTGEPGPQRILDDWLDQGAETLRALGERAADLAPVLARYAGPTTGSGVADAATPLDETTTPSETDAEAPRRRPVAATDRAGEPAPRGCRR